MYYSNFKQNKLINIWLIICTSLVVLMIILGGYTRLTNSGLSIVEWKPISGIIPPIHEADWEVEFLKYKNTPEYQQHNFNMSLQEFKYIFWVEFAHRLVGRVTVLIYCLPLIFFYFTRKIKFSNFPHFIALFLFFLQGFIGWYMVYSGVKDLPYVSHYRLTLHLLLAIILYGLLYWQIMINSFDILIISHQINLLPIKKYCLIFIFLVFIQIFFGGLLAGLKGGLIYNSFPLMGDSFIPYELRSGDLDAISLNNPIFIQFIHRINAFILIISGCLFYLTLIATKNNKLIKVARHIIFALIFQTIAGIITIIYAVPLLPALIHQIGVIYLLSVILWCYFLLKSA